MTVLAGTDALLFGSLHEEIPALQRHGMDPTGALASATTVPRAFLGEAGLEEGAPADLLTFEEDPRDDPELLRKPAAIVFGGKRIA